jgi:hypothetical protein
MLFYKLYVAGHLIEGANKRHRRASTFSLSVNCPRGALPPMLFYRRNTEWNYFLSSPRAMMEMRTLDTMPRLVVVLYCVLLRAV